ncbi:hypothetical protein STCU_07516 [Strigomonas culicis]|uniref:Uncharacterized protein n=1 Tax=Strigomonas culicis TaxID=28005 RepID=S9U4M6_9TRYP|nr:hypothetical protein STCU_07516 [Strigomonas culicis]|eukprot:EPY23724.1 hypothetical protein STCU_07516 [Strigomonas culicis]
MCTLRHHRGPVNHALFLADPNLLLTASDDRTLGLWDIRNSASPLGTVTGFGEGVNKMLLLPASPSCVPTDGKGFRVASVCDDGMVYIHAVMPPEALSPAAGAPVAVLTDQFMASTSTVNDLILLDRCAIVTACEDGALRTWKLNATGGEDRMLATLDEFGAPVNHVVVVPDNDWMCAHREAAGESAEEDSDHGDASAAMGGSSGRHTATGPRAELTAADGCWLLAASAENVFGVDVYRSTGQFGEGARSFFGHSDYVRGLEFTSKSTLLTVADDSTAIEWNLCTNEPIRQVKLHEALIMSSALSADKTVLATGTDTGDIRVWRLPFETECLCDH